MVLKFFLRNCLEMILLLAGLLVFPDLLGVRANAQVSGGTISGTVTGATQLAMPNARVTLKNVATGVARVVTTGAGGSYTSPNLEPGAYEITVEASGFSTQVRTGIAVAVGAKLVVNVAMQTGESSEVIREPVPLVVETQASSSAGGNVNSSTVRDSPLNGRDW